jgi:hypothetical protein
VRKKLRVRQRLSPNKPSSTPQYFRGIQGWPWEGGYGRAFLWASVAQIAGCATGQNANYGSNTSISGSLRKEPQAAPDAPPKRDIAGVVVNDYIKNAVVFNDENGNSVLDTGESVALTDTSGRYALKAAPSTAIIAKPIAHLNTSEVNVTSLSLGMTPEALLALSTTKGSTGQPYDLTLTNMGSSVSQSVTLNPFTTLQKTLVDANVDSALAEKIVIAAGGTNYAEDYRANSDIGNIALAENIATIYKLASSNPNVGDINKQLADLMLLTYNNTMDGADGDFLFKKIVSSATDMGNAYIDYVVDKGVEVTPELNAEITNILADLAATTDPTELIALQNDTGYSAVDRITADPTLHFNPTLNYSYSLSLTDGDQGLSTVNDPNELIFDSGENTVYIYDENGLPLSEFTFFYDHEAPAWSDELIALTISNYVPVGSLSLGGNYYETLNTLKKDSYVLPEVAGSDFIIEVRYGWGVDSETLSALDFSWIRRLNSAETKLNGDILTIDYSLVDKAGNRSETRAYEFWFDNVMPASVETATLNSESDSGIYDDDFYTNKNPVLVTTKKFLSGEVSDDIRVEFLLDGDLYDYSQDIPDGSHVLSIYQTDLVGNSGPSTKLEFIYDTVAPVRDFEIYGTEGQFSLDKFNTLGGETYYEWLQYGISDPEGMLSWANFITPRDLGRLSSVRWIDLAGNVGDSYFVNGSSVSSDAYFTDFSNNWADGFALNEGAPQVFTQSNGDAIFVGSRQIMLESPLVTLSRTISAGTLIGSDIIYPALEKWELLDSSVKQEVSLNTSSNLNYGQYLNQTEAISFCKNAREGDYFVFGGGGDDLLNNFTVGDIFYGGNGSDRVVLSNDYTVRGVAPLSGAEVKGFVSPLTSGGLSGDGGYDGWYRVYLESDGDSGLAITDSEMISSNSTVDILYQFDQITNRYAFYLTDNIDDLFVGGGEGAVVYGSFASNRLYGGEGDDTLIGSGSYFGSDEYLSGAGGNDTLVLGDYVNHGYSGGTIDGGDGDDVLIVIESSASVSGGDGADWFYVLNDTKKNQVISVQVGDFRLGTDKFFIDGLQSERLLGNIFRESSGDSYTVDLWGATAGLFAFGSTLTLGGVDGYGGDAQMNIEDITRSFATYEDDLSLVGLLFS